MNRAGFSAAALVCLVLGIWEGAVRIWEVPVFVLPPPSLIGWVAITKAPVILPHASVTGAEICLGVLLALATAVPLAVAMFAKPVLEKALSPFLVASQAIPVFALAPLLVIWLGYGIASKVFMAWIIIFFPITVSLLQGLKSCDPEYQTLFTLMGSPVFQNPFPALLALGPAPVFRRTPGGGIRGHHRSCDRRMGWAPSRDWGFS